MENSESVSCSYPLALGAAYPIGETNQTIQLYDGSLELIYQEAQAQGNGAIFLDWFPYPHIKFQFSHQDVDFDLKQSGPFLGEASLNLPAFKDIKVNILGPTTWHMTTQEYITETAGHLRHPILLTMNQDTSYVLFHLTNFHNFSGTRIISEGSKKPWSGRIVLEAEGWRVTIDALEKIDHLMRSLHSLSGFAVTHVGRLERLDGKTFTEKEAFTFLEALYYFVSFVRGLWSGPILPVGYSADGKVTWREWNAQTVRVDPWQDYQQEVHSWFSSLYSQQCLVDVFPGFLRQWQDWSESLGLAIHWYVESNKHVAGVEGSIVLVQAALELLSSVVLLENKNLTGKSKKEFEDKNAADKIRQILSEFHIPQNVASSLTSLVELMKNHNLSDGSYAFTWIRNKIVHPSPGNRQKLFDSPSSAKVEAWELGLWYLELVLLHLFNYQGVYTNRILRSRWKGGMEEVVPWACVDKLI